MRLLNITTLELRSFNEANIPDYAIISHRWLDDDQELSFQDYIFERGRERAGYRKITDFCAYLRQTNVPGRTKRRALSSVDPMREEHSIASYQSGAPRRVSPLRIQWAWIDTICIDKSSSAELSEAINSMFEYYAQAAACIVYLGDVSITPCGRSERCAGMCDQCEASQDQLRTSEWFQRGWTLQELVAPSSRIFVSSDWHLIGHLSSTSPNTSWGSVLLDCIADITRIPSLVLRGGAFDLKATSVAQRLSWAAHRRTTRTEDRSYSLFGLLGVNMPLLYGEGHWAWTRLQEEII